MAANLPNDGSFFEQFQRMQKEKDAVSAREEEEALKKDAHDPLPPLPDETVAPVVESARSAANASTSNPAAVEPTVESKDSLFLRSATFTGPKAGFLFKLGDAGQGESCKHVMQTCSSDRWSGVVL